VKRRVVYLTGTRADYGLFTEPLRRMLEHPLIDPSVLVTGMHLDPKYGPTIDEIRTDGFPLVGVVEAYAHGEPGMDQVRALSAMLRGIGEQLAAHRTEILVVLGDRGEVLVGALAANHLRIPVAHLHGGERTGTIDELVRHATTKLAHVHLVATEDAAQRIRRLGEEPWRVHVTGAPGLDYLRRLDPIPRTELAASLDFDPSKPIVLFTLHPVPGEPGEPRRQMAVALEALAGAGVQVLATYPNSDGGGAEMVAELKHRSAEPWLRVVPSLGARPYTSVLREAAAVVGNSSSGIIEAPFFGVPAVNVGPRQEGRLRGANVIDVEVETGAVRAGIECALHDEQFIARARSSGSPYGDGRAGERIAELLANLRLGPALLDKQMTY
jgi:GDP/UDP-N,N'-diacetylbacillosamine 2-epimerase (hydrolysing)